MLHLPLEAALSNFHHPPQFQASSPGDKAVTIASSTGKAERPVPKEKEEEKDTPSISSPSTPCMRQKFLNQL
jgi:hypothetical protein